MTNAESSANCQHDTTGGLVFYYHDSYMMRSAIAVDNGHYGGTIEELNVRVLDQTDDFEVGIGRIGPKTKSIISSKVAYGCGWGGTSALYPITEDEAEIIRQEMTDMATIPQADTDVVIAAKTRHISQKCEKCGTYCYGDCDK